MRIRFVELVPAFLLLAWAIVEPDETHAQRNRCFLYSNPCYYSAKAEKKYGFGSRISIGPDALSKLQFHQVPSYSYEGSTTRRYEAEFDECGKMAIDLPFNAGQDIWICCDAEAGCFKTKIGKAKIRTLKHQRNDGTWPETLGQTFVFFEYDTMVVCNKAYQLVSLDRLPEQAWESVPVSEKNKKEINAFLGGIKSWDGTKIRGIKTRSTGLYFLVSYEIEEGKEKNANHYGWKTILLRRNRKTMNNLWSDYVHSAEPFFDFDGDEIPEVLITYADSPDATIFSIIPEYKKIAHFSSGQ